MTALVVQRPDMPGYNPHELDDVQTPSSDYNSFYQTALASSTGLYPFSSQTGPSSDALGAAPWDTTGEGAQNFQQDFLDNGSSHPGDTEDFSFHLDGQMTPRGQAQTSAVEELQAKWNTIPGPSAAGPIGGEPMRRGNSRTSTGSHKHRIVKPASKARLTTLSSQVSAQLSTMDITGNSAVYSAGSQPNGHMDVNSCLFLDGDASGVSSHMLYPEMSMDLNLGHDGLPSPPTEMGMRHVDPAHMHLDPDASLTSHSPSASWTSFSTPESRLTSPAGSPEEAWLPDPLMASPPRSDNGSPALQSGLRTDGLYTSQDLIANDLSTGMLAMVGEESALPPSYTSRRPTNEGESARDHPLYKSAAAKSDGLYHCPWEGQSGCNHKPEKLKCNYDKFVDSHLKPYRCKDSGCENARFSSTACLLRHEREAHAMHGHGDKPFLCTYEGCDRALSGNGFPRQWNLRDHMRRVHNDNRIPGSPTGQIQNQQSSKGRKRKEAPKTTTPAAGRKASAKASVVEAAAREEQAQRPLLDEWIAHRKALEDIILELGQPQDTRNAQLIKEAQNRLSRMSKMTGVGITVRRSYSSG